VELELSPHLKYVAALPCETLSGQLNYTPLHSYRPSENNIFISVRWHLFHEFLFVYLFFLPDADIIMTLLQYFVCCIDHSFQL